GYHGVAGFLLRRRPGTALPTLRIAAQQYQMRHALRMPCRIRNRYGAALRDTEQRKAIEAGGIDDGFEIVDEVRKGDVDDLTVRKPVAACIVADQGAITGKVAIEAAPDRAVEIELQVREPVAGLHQRGPVADPGIGQLHAVFGLAEMDLLLVTHAGPGLARPGGREINVFRDGDDIA